MQIGKVGVGLLSMAMAMALTAGTASAQDEDAKKPATGQDEKKSKKKKVRNVFGILPLKALAKELGLEKKTAKKLAPAYKEATKGLLKSAPGTRAVSGRPFTPTRRSWAG